MHASPFVCAALFLLGGEPASRLLYPPDKLHSHSACVTECPSGDLIACWYRGSGERRADDVRIMGARLRKGAAAWSKPYLMADTPGYPDCNPVAYVDSKKQLWLFWPTIIDHRWEGAILKAKRATKYDADGPPAWDHSEVVHLDPKDLAPQLEKAFATIADSNVTTLIAGVVLFAFGTGTIRSFAIVMTLGILTSLFTSVVGSRALVHWIWGRRTRLAHLPI